MGAKHILLKIRGCHGTHGTYANAPAETPRINVKELYLPEDGFSLKLHQVFSSEIIMIQRLVEWFGANVFIGREKIIGPFCQYWMRSLSQFFLIFLQNHFSSFKDVFIIQFL